MEPQVAVPPIQTATKNARQLALLGMLLQFLHILFGITAIIGVIVTQTHKHNTLGSVYQSHLRWQFVTFWIALVGYASGFYLWITHSTPWLAAAVLALVNYRLIVNYLAWINRRAIDRWF